jgi:hypothetical protein
MMGRARLCCKPLGFLAKMKFRKVLLFLGPDRRFGGMPKDINFYQPAGS